MIRSIVTISGVRHDLGADQDLAIGKAADHIAAAFFEVEFHGSAVRRRA